MGAQNECDSGGQLHDEVSNEQDGLLKSGGQTDVESTVRKGILRYAFPALLLSYVKVSRYRIGVDRVLVHSLFSSIRATSLATTAAALVRSQSCTTIEAQCCSV